MTREDQLNEMHRTVDTLRTALAAANETLKFVREDRHALREELEATRRELHLLQESAPRAASTNPPPRRALTPPTIPSEFEDGFDIELS